MDSLRTQKSRILEALLLVSLSALVHIWLLLASKIFPDAIPFGDLSLYNYWVFEFDQGKPLYGVSTEWVYPALAFLPMWLAKQISFFDYEFAWLTMVFILNSIAALSLQATAKQGRNFAPFVYLAGIFLLGPVAVSRIDAVSVALAVIGLLMISRNSVGIASALFTIAGWIKVWPIALFLALVASFKAKIKIFAVASGISLGIIAISISLSGNLNVFSFVFSQQDRGIQIESVIATVFLWLAKSGLGKIYFDQSWLTNQVVGPGSELVASISNLVLFVALGITFVLALRALARGVKREVVFALAGFTSVLDLIVFNKVGSPQFMLWLLVPAIALIIFGVPRLGFALVAVAVVLLLTQFIYPILYIQLLGLELLPLTLITIRNLLLIALLVWANYRLSSEKAL